MTLAFKAQLPSTPKFVLLALADSANDQGECYPSIKTVMDKCSLAERTVQESIVALEHAGYVRREFRNGRSTTYWITLDPRTSRTPAPAAPPQQAHHTPAPSAPPPPHQPHPRGAPGAPITISESSIEPKRGSKGSRIPQDWALTEALCAYAAKKGVNAEAEAEAFVDHWRASVKPDAFKADWDAAFRTWVRNSIKFAKPGGETAWQRSQRERVAEMSGGLVSKKTPASNDVMEVFDAPRLLG